MSSQLSSEKTSDDCSHLSIAGVDAFQTSRDNAGPSMEFQASNNRDGDENKRISRKDAIRHVFSFFVDTLVTRTVVHCHRDAALNRAVGVTCREDTEMPPTCSTPGLGRALNGGLTLNSTSKRSGTPAGDTQFQPSLTVSSAKKQIECQCYACHRVIAASRLAPHLEKCIGLGRNSSRVARKRLAHYAGVVANTGHSQSASSSPRVNARVSVSSTATTLDADLTDGDSFQSAVDLDDVDWTASLSNESPKRRRANLAVTASPTYPVYNSNSSSRSNSRFHPQ